MPPGDVTVNIPGLHVLLRAPYGMIGRDLIRRANNVAAQARQLCPVGDGRSGRHLRDTIEADKRPFDTGSGLGLYVRAKAPYAIYVHEGTRGHAIEPRTRTVLRFTVGGDVVFARRVQHPGTKANPFLRKALPAAAH